MYNNKGTKEKLTLHLHKIRQKFLNYMLMLISQQFLLKQFIILLSAEKKYFKNISAVKK